MQAVRATFFSVPCEALGFSDDRKTVLLDVYDKFVGKVQERYGDKKDELMKWADQ